MSQIAFSHQFSKRWLSAPQQIKSAIVQELDDIVQLLNDKTDLNEFEFNHPDLRGHIDMIYDKLAQEKAEKLALQEQEEREKEVLIAQEEAFRAAENKMRETTEKESNKTYLNQNNVSNNDSHSINKDAVQHASKTTITSEPSKLDKAPHEVYNPEAVSTTEVGTSSIDESLIKELENRIDDYLSEQLAIMSEDLKAWLRDQISQNK